MAVTTPETFISRYGVIAQECGISKAFEYFLNEREVEFEHELAYIERCKLVITFIGEVFAVKDQQVTLSHTTFHIKPVPGDKPLWTCCKRFLAQE